jgi:hypothetical protein
VAATILLAWLIACSKPSDPPASAAAPRPIASAAMPAPAPTMDLMRTDHASRALDLAAGARHTEAVRVPPGHTIRFAVMHTGGALATMSLAIYDARNPGFPVSTDGMKCAEPGCSFSVEVAAAAAARTLIAICSVEAAMSVRFDATVPPPTR